MQRGLALLNTLGPVFSVGRGLLVYRLRAIDRRPNLASLSALLFLPIPVLFALSFPNDWAFSRAVKRLSERVQHDSRVND